VKKLYGGTFLEYKFSLTIFPFAEENYAKNIPYPWAAPQEVLPSE
jgi:hypothetical protein